MYKYFIKEVSRFYARNKFQEKLISKIHNMLHKTLKDDAALCNFEKYLQKKIEESHDLYPRSKKAVVKKRKGTHLDYEYYINVDSATGDHYCLVAITIATNTGEWQEKGECNEN